MSKIIDWDKIWKDSADIVIKHIEAGDALSKVSQLYKELEDKFDGESKQDELPKYNTYRQRIHQVLGIESNKGNIKTELYKFAGKYSNMTIDNLCEQLSVSSANESNNSNWLFIKLKRNIEKEYYKKKYTAVQSHLYHLSHKLKDKYKEEIVFASFDSNTLVILCKDSKAKENIGNYIAKFNNGSNQEGNER